MELELVSFMRVIYSPETFVFKQAFGKPSGLYVAESLVIAGPPSKLYSFLQVVNTHMNATAMNKMGNLLINRKILNRCQGWL